MAAAAVVVAAGALLAAPIAVAAIALVAPQLLDRLAGWLTGASVAFAIVAAGRVPAAAVIVLLAARRREYE